MDEGATEIRLLNRTLGKAQALADEFGKPLQAFDWAQRHAALAGASLLVNTTNQGMHGQPELDLQLHELPKSALVSDAIYVPLQTHLLASAQQRGNATVNGLGMLLNQARPAFQAWFGVMPDIDDVLVKAITDSL